MEVARYAQTPWMRGLVAFFWLMVTGALWPMGDPFAENNSCNIKK
jgi:hypothetical protein